MMSGGRSRVKGAGRAGRRDHRRDLSTPAGQSNLYLGIGCLLLALVFGLAVLIATPDGPGRSSRAIFGATLVLLYAGFPAWVLLDSRRASLTFRGSRVIAQGVVRRVEMDLAAVVEARWKSGPAGGLVLRDGVNRLALGLGPHELDGGEREAVVTRLREAIPPDVQKGWDLFAYRTRFGEAAPPPAGFRRPGRIGRASSSPRSSPWP